MNMTNVLVWIASLALFAGCATSSPPPATGVGDHKLAPSMIKARDKPVCGIGTTPTCPNP